MAIARQRLLPLGGSPQDFAADWLASVLDWTSLYFVFAGLTSVALGLSRMAGLTLEENFDHPWRARNLIDFWTRWHMSLTSWCRDYVFTPVTALTRSPVAGLFAGMLLGVLFRWLAGGLLLAASLFLLALASTAVRDRPVLRRLLLVLGIFGTAIFFGDGVITPAVSVLGAIEGLTLETLILAPLAAAGLIWWSQDGGMAGQTAVDWAWLIGTGPVTAGSLLLFAAGARRIPLATLGLVQYVSPSLQFLLGVFLFREPMDATRLVAFACIWGALAIYSAEGLWRSRRAPQRSGPERLGQLLRRPRRKAGDDAQRAGVVADVFGLGGFGDREQVRFAGQERERDLADRLAALHIPLKDQMDFMNALEDTVAQQLQKVLEPAFGNQADQMVHMVKKSLTEYGDKLEAGEKDKIEAAIKEVEEVIKGDDKDAIEAKTNTLMEASQKLGEKVYAEQQAQQGGAEAQPQGEKTVDADVVDAEFEEVKDEKK